MHARLLKKINLEGVYLNTYTVHVNYIIFRHLWVEIAQANPAWNDWKKLGDISASQGLILIPAWTRLMRLYGVYNQIHAHF